MNDAFDSIDQTPQVLIVEDEPRLRDLLLHALPDMGFAGKGVQSGEDGLRALEAETYKIIVLDLNLPGLGGLEFFEKVREKWPGTQVIVLTGFGDLETAQKAIQMNVSDFLTKPCPLGDLESALDRARRRLAPEGKPRLSKIADEPDIFEDPPTAQERGAATLREIERDHILASLQRNEGNRQETAEELGISVRTLYYRLGEYQKEGFDV